MKNLALSTFKKFQQCQSFGDLSLLYINVNSKNSKFNEEVYTYLWFVL